MDEQQVTLAVQVVGPVVEKTLMGRPHRIFPVVLVREQVLHNNIGRTYLPADEIAASVDAWNGMPIVIRHPSKRGMPVSARDPDVLNTRGAGQVFNARYEDGTLKGDAWIDMTLAEAMPETGDVVNRVDAGEIGEVSTGFGTMAERTPGEFDGRAYDLILRSLRPDHLALLPDETGACSVKDGCGLGVNCSCGGHEAENDATEWTDLEIPPTVAIEEVAKNEGWRRFISAAARLLGLTATNEEPEEEPDDEPAANEPGTITPDEGTTMNREQKIAHLAGAGRDRAALDALPDADIDALYNASTANNSQPSGDGWDKAREWREKFETLQRQTATAVNAEEAERTELLDDVLYNVANSPWTEDEIKAMSIVELRKVHKALSRKPTDYSLRGGPRTQNSGGNFDFASRSILADNGRGSIFDSEAN